MKLGYIIGRFNPLHLGHHNLIEYLLSNCDDHIIFIGSSNESRTNKNPLTFEERKSLIKLYYPNTNILSMPDNISIDIWKNEFHSKINNYINASKKHYKDISLFSPTRDDDHELRADWIPSNHLVHTFSPSYDISATELRKLWYESSPFDHLVKKDTIDFLKNIKI